MNGMHQCRNAIMKVLGIGITILFAAMTVIGTYQICARYFFNSPSTVSEELLTYSFTWMSLLASAYVFGKRDHMRMGFLADKFRGNGRKYFEAVIDGLTILFAAIVMVYGGIVITRLTMTQVTASLQIPMGLVYSIVPVSGILIILFGIMNAVDMLYTDFSKQEE